MDLHLKLNDLYLAPTAALNGVLTRSWVLHQINETHKYAEQHYIDLETKTG